MLNTLLRFQQIRQLLGVFRFASDGNDLQTVVVIEVDMLGGNYYILKIMLDIKHPGNKLSFVMVINECDCTGDLAGAFPFFFDQFLADQVPDSFGPVLIFFVSDMPVKIDKQTILKRYPEPCYS